MSAKRRRKAAGPAEPVAPPPTPEQTMFDVPASNPSNPT